MSTRAQRSREAIPQTNTVPTKLQSQSPRKPSRRARRVADRSIANYCCHLQKRHRQGAGAQGSGFIVQFEDLVSEGRELLLALHWEKRDRAGEIETNYVLITSHDTIPGSLEEGWTFSCQGIENGGEQPLSNLVCGIISCCGPECFLGPGHNKAKVLKAHPNANCPIQLNITVIFLNNNFVKLLNRSAKKRSCQSTSTIDIAPPVVLIRKCLNHNACRTEREKIIFEASRVKEHNNSETVQVYHCAGSSGFPQTTAVSIIDSEQPQVPQHHDVVTQEVILYEKSQKLFYHGTESGSTRSALVGKGGSPLVYHNQDANETTVIGVHVGESDQQGKHFAVTFCGILQLLEGGLVPVLSLLHFYKAPRLWPSRWSYLVAPHLENPEKPMTCRYLCDILHYLVEPRFGTQLVKLSVDLPDVENEAALDLLCSLFKHFGSADHAVLHGAITGSYNEFSGKGIDSDVTQLCESLLHLLTGAVREPRQKQIVPAEAVSLVEAENREMLVEKCCKFYNCLLNVKYAGITVQVLHTSENLDLLESVRQRYKSSAVVQEIIPDIFLKCYRDLESRHKEVCEQNYQEKQKLKEEQRKQSKKLYEVCTELDEEKAQHQSCKRKLQMTETELNEKKRRLSMVE